MPAKSTPAGDKVYGDTNNHEHRIFGRLLLFAHGSEMQPDSIWISKCGSLCVRIVCRISFSAWVELGGVDDWQLMGRGVYLYLAATD